jgi:hypothetical protein
VTDQWGGEGGLTHADGVDFADDSNSRAGTVENVYGLIQASLINDDLPIVLLVLLFRSAKPLEKLIIRRTTIHLLPSSSSNFAGFLASVTGFLPTTGGDFF